jgi:trigger factor
MDVTETNTDGLKREFKVVVPASELDARLNDRLSQLKDRVQLRGFRPGKVPVTHLKKVYGRGVMAETIDELVRETNAKIVTDRGLKLAMDPKITMPESESEIEGIINGKSDLAYTLALEVVPAITLADFKQISLEKLSADVSEDEISDAVGKIADSSRPFGPKPEGGKVEQGDRVVVKFTGTMDGQPFEGGSGDDIPVQIGSNTFIPGFEDQLIGMAAGETRTVNVTFPGNYTATNLAGKPAVFEVTAKSIETPGTVTVDDAFAKSLGLESLEKLRAIVKERLTREHAAQSRQKVKRVLLDELDKLHKFDPPPSLVEQEFNNVWGTVMSDLQSQNRSFADEGTTEEKAREEYRGIADRRVRLGLVLAEIGEKNSIKVTDDELQRAIVEQARQYPGREQEVWDHYRKNPQAVATLRAPIYEEKVVDYILELAKVTDRQVTREELYKEDEA